MKLKINVPLKQSLKDNSTLQLLKRALEVEYSYKAREVCSQRKGK